MEILYAFHDNMLRQVNNHFYRFLYGQINWDQQLLAIKGPRGAGKTTLMLQHIRYHHNDSPAETLYISADHHWFYTHTLAETVDDFVKGGGKNIFIDEVHKYPHWSREIKNIHDAWPDLKIVISGSSALELYKGEADLSRRLITYNLPGMSFREYLVFNHIGSFPALRLSDMEGKHLHFSREINDALRPLPAFKKYLQFGYLPFYKPGNEKEYMLKLLQVIHTTVETDLAIIEGFNAGTAQKIKKLLGVLSESAPFKPNIAALARKLDASRDSVYEWIALLNRASMINTLTKEGNGTATLQKPEKIFLENTNQAYAIKNNPDMGNLRETFLFNQLTNKGITTTYPNEGDFKTDEFLIEVGGKNKPLKATKDNYLVAADDIENGYKNKIPLWLFGFLY
jgi:uncharacterized protein